MGTYHVAQPHSGASLSSKEEWRADRRRDPSKPWKHRAEDEKDSDAKGRVLLDFVYTEYPEQVNP